MFFFFLFFSFWASRIKKEKERRETEPREGKRTKYKEKKGFYLLFLGDACGQDEKQDPKITAHRHRTRGIRPRTKLIRH